MAYLDRIVAANQHHIAEFLPFYVAAKRLGSVRRSFAAELRRWPNCFSITPERAALSPALDQAPPDVKTDAVAGVVSALVAEGYIEGFRNELFPVSESRQSAPIFLLERSALPYFGFRAYGVHINGFVRDGEQLLMWIGLRAANKPTWPGLLDQMVAGGQPHGVSLMENVIKESWEEARVPKALAHRAVPTGALGYLLETPAGLRPDIVFTYDLELPQDFVPENDDGEVAGFECHPIETVAEIVRDSTRFKFNCGLVVMHFLIRHGILQPDEPDYLQLVAGLAPPELPAL